MMGIAAALYAGVGQTRSSLDDTTAAAVARQAAATLSQVMTLENTAECMDDKFKRFGDSDIPALGALQAAVAGSQICASDSRYAWIPFYRREQNSSVAQLLIIVVRAQSRSAFDAKDLATADPLYPPTLVAAPAVAQGVHIEDNELSIQLPGGTERLAPGTLVVLNGDRLTGRVVRLSAPGANGRWTLDPGQDLADDIAAFREMVKQNSEVDPTYHWDVDGFIVGRGYADVNQPAKGFTGASQAIAAYSTMVTLR